tara:strand:- start:1021 stop:1647 length:627 start_codon:yes stop_codon:yes gene_type:complete
MNKYKILGQPRAGSLIPEFLLTELGIDYILDFPKKSDLIDPNHEGFNPLGKIPVLICPDGEKIFETVAIVTHITTQFSKLIPLTHEPEYIIYWQLLALLSTTVYPAYHRQHHPKKYVDEVGVASLQINAQEEQAIVFNYIEGLLSPYLCGKKITAVDFYFYTLMRWDLNKTKLREGRPNLARFLNVLRSRSSVDKVLLNQKINENEWR